MTLHFYSYPFIKVVDKVARRQFTVSRLWFYSNVAQPHSFN